MQLYRLQVRLTKTLKNTFAIFFLYQCYVSTKPYTYFSVKRSVACTFPGVRIEDKVNQASTAGTNIAFWGLGKASSHFLA